MMRIGACSVGSSLGGAPRENRNAPGVPQCELMGRPVAISNSMPSSGTGSAYILLCGDPSFYLTRFVKGLGVQFYKEALNLIEYGLVCASLVRRADCGVPRILPLVRIGMHS
jgi:HK97 family phage major capsid protein